MISGVDKDEGIGLIGAWGDGVDADGIGSVGPILGRGSSDNLFERADWDDPTGAGIELISSAPDSEDALPFRGV